MKIILIGLDHKTAPVHIRERFAIGPGNYEAFNSRLDEHKSIYEKVVLSTCNRTEIYLACDHEAAAGDHVISVLAEFSCLSPEICRQHLHIISGEEVVRHVFSVAAGIESMVMGETEILGQVKHAYLKAHEFGYTGKALNQLFQKALKIGKQARSQTSIGLGRVSVASVAVDLAKKIFLKINEKKILLIGSGEIARQVCESLHSAGSSDLIIANRNQERAEALVSDFGGKSIPFEEIDKWAGTADIIIGSAGSPRAFIDQQRVSKWLEPHHRKGMFLIDLGLPRNIHEEVNQLEDVYLYNLDDLNQIAGQNLRSRKQAADDCRKLIEHSLSSFIRWHKTEYADEAAKGRRHLKGGALQSQTGQLEEDN